MHKMWVNFKVQRQNQFFMMSHRKQGEEVARQEKTQEMMAKLARS